MRTLFVADRAETDLPSSLTIQDAGSRQDLSVQQLVDRFAPVLHFNLGERYAMPFNVQTSLEADASGGVPDWLRVTGSTADHLDLSVLATGVWPRIVSQTGLRFAPGLSGRPERLSGGTGVGDQLLGALPSQQLE